MFIFPQNLYTDVRIEEVTKTTIVIRDDTLLENKKSSSLGAFIRIFDGQRWYYSATTRLKALQQEIDVLAQMATPNEAIYSHPAISVLEVNTGTFITYEHPIKDIPSSDKQALIEHYAEFAKEKEEVATYTARYLDTHVTKHIYSSKGTNLTFDTQHGGFSVRYSLKVNNKPFDYGYSKGMDTFEALKNFDKEVKESLEKGIAFIQDAKPVEAGKYTVIFAPIATGVFTHESFGHKSESDLMLGSETMKKEWELGKKVGVDTLTIIDRGDLRGSGYVPFDDEGNKARVNYIVKEGTLTGRLHSASTSAQLEEGITGNARAMNFEFEPIVRMTSTYIDKGPLTKEELFTGVKDGIYIDNINHGSGMSTFTIAPSTAYRIRDGKIAEPVMISVVSGNVMETLHHIDGISNEVENLSFVGGGCGKMEQYPLPVGFGGPYIRVNHIQVQ
jgi:TldD protein